MFFQKNLLLALVFIILSISLIAFFKTDITQVIEKRTLKLNSYSDNLGPPKETSISGKRVVKYAQDYTIVLLGDSMTEKLGNADEFKSYLKKYYPNKTFQVLNYGYGSTNILSIQERLEKETDHGRKFDPILDIAFDLILIESFGHNPLSQYPLEEGLAKQNEALDKALLSIKENNPKAKVVFVATIAPNKKRYAEGQVSLSSAERKKWAEEREAYIKNHIKYAKDRQIPVVDIYTSSLKNGDGNLDYIDTKDFIHPSPTGVYFISEKMAKYIFENRILIN